MRRKRINHCNGEPVKDVAPVLEPSLEKLAAVLVEIAGMSKSRFADGVSAISSNPLGFLSTRIRGAMMAGRYGQLAEVFTAPDSVQQIVKMAKLNPNGITAQYYTAALLGLDRSQTDY